MLPKFYFPAYFHPKPSPGIETSKNSQSAGEIRAQAFCVQSECLVSIGNHTVSSSIEREKPYDYLLIIQTGKNSRRKFAGRCSLKPFFSHLRFSEFPYKMFPTALYDIIGLQNFLLSFCQSLSNYDV